MSNLQYSAVRVRSYLSRLLRSTPFLWILAILVFAHSLKRLLLPVQPCESVNGKVDINLALCG